jgi:hypothetical protein
LYNFSSTPIAHIDRAIAATHALLLNWAGTLEEYAKKNKPWRDRTSHTTQGIHGGVDRDGNTFSLYLAHTQETGKYLEEGTGLHGPHHQEYIIRPKTKKALFWDGASHPVKAVHHPGMKPQAIIGPTIDAHADRIKKTVWELWTE